MLESEERLVVHHFQTHLRFSLAQQYMRIRLIDGGRELAVLEVRSADELSTKLTRDTLRKRVFSAEQLQVHLWHSGAWWNLSEDLSEFFSWIIETGEASFDETRQFAKAPLSRSDWLYEAARQMQTLLTVASQATEDRME
ncbi:MAG: hypothetical protein ACE5G0_18335 [Rhodothermales bacterium]